MHIICHILAFWLLFLCLSFSFGLLIYFPVLRLTTEDNTELRKTQNSNLKPSEGREQLTNVRRVQRNLVHIVGLPLNLADEQVRDFVSSKTWLLYHSRLLSDGEFFSFFFFFSASTAERIF